MYSNSQGQTSRPKPPSWRISLRDYLCKVRLRELSELENPLTPEEQTWGLMVIYRKLKRHTGLTSGGLCSQVDKLSKKEGEKQSEPYFQWVQPPDGEIYYSLGAIAEALGLGPKEALELAGPELKGLLPEGDSLNLDTLFPGKEIKEVQEVLVREKEKTLLLAGKSAEKGRTPSYVVVGAERDTPVELMEYDPLKDLVQKDEEERAKLEERRKAAWRQYQAEIDKVTNKPKEKEFSPWAEKYEKMKALINKRQAEIEACHLKKKNKWDPRLIDGWVERHPSDEESSSKKPKHDSGFYNSVLLQTMLLFLCLCAFTTCRWSVGLSDSTRVYGLNVVNFWTHLSDYTPYLFNTLPAWILPVMAIEAWFCRWFFCRFMEWYDLELPPLGLVVTFVAADLLLQPFLYSLFFSFSDPFLICSLLQAPLATLLHISALFVVLTVIALLDLLLKIVTGSGNTSGSKEDRAGRYTSRQSNDNFSGRSSQNRSRIKQLLDGGPDISVGGQTLVLFLCMLVFLCFWRSFERYDSIFFHAYYMLRYMSRFWVNIPSSITSLLGEHDAVFFLILTALEVWGCRAYFCNHFPDNNIYATMIWLPVTFVLMDLLIQPFLYSFLYTFIKIQNPFPFCYFLQAPLATLLHMGVWSVRKKKEVKSSRR